MLRIEEFILYLKDLERSENTIKNYQLTLKQFDDYLKANDIFKLTKEEMIKYKLVLKDKYSINSRNNKITLINAYFIWNNQDELKLKQFKVQEESHKEYLTFKEYKRLIKAIDKQEIRLLVYLVANTGLRIGEVVKSLKKEDLNSKLIEIEKKGKTRPIAIPQWLKKELKEYFKDLENQDYLFPKSRQYYSKVLKKYAGIAKIKLSRVYPHAFRHLFSKKFIDDGNDSTTLQQLLGHSDIKTTSIYTKKNKDELAKEFLKQKNK